MATMAKWGPKTWAVSAKQVVALEGLSFSFAQVAVQRNRPKATDKNRRPAPMRGPILREQLLAGVIGEYAGWDKGNQKKGGITMQSEKPPRSSYEPLRLRVKIDEMIQYGRPLTKQFSRKDRDLADDMRQCMLQMYRLAIELEKKYYRKTTTKELDIELEWLRHLVRMAASKDYCGVKYAPPLSMHQYEVWSRLNDEIGRMIGGYIGSLEQ